MSVADQRGSIRGRATRIGCFSLSFADVVNWWFADEHVGTDWRLQELPDTELRQNVSDMPQFGRGYDVFYNQVRIGTLEVSPGADYGSENPDVRTSIQLEWMRLLHVYTIREFLSSVGIPTSSLCRSARRERPGLRWWFKPPLTAADYGRAGTVGTQ
jgi:hypothetical protein